MATSVITAAQPVIPRFERELLDEGIRVLRLTTCEPGSQPKPRLYGLIKTTYSSLDRSVHELLAYRLERVEGCSDEEYVRGEIYFIRSVPGKVATATRVLGLYCPPLARDCQSLLDIMEYADDLLIAGIETEDQAAAVRALVNVEAIGSVCWSCLRNDVLEVLHSTPLDEYLPEDFEAFCLNLPVSAGADYIDIFRETLQTVITAMLESISPVTN